MQFAQYSDSPKLRVSGCLSSTSRAERAHVWSLLAANPDRPRQLPSVGLKGESYLDLDVPQREGGAANRRPSMARTCCAADHEPNGRRTLPV
jgi:hypothetical protein